MISPQERRFVAYYIKAGMTDAADAWARAFFRNGKPVNIRERAIKPGNKAKALLKTVRIQEEIARQMEPVAQASRTGALRLIRELEAIAYADRRELTSVRYVNCRHCWGTGFQYQRTQGEAARAQAEEVDAARREDREPNKLDFAGGVDFDRTRPPHPDCPECSGEGERDIVIADMAYLSEDAVAIYEGVQQTKEGLKVLTTSKMDALKMLGQMWGVTPETIKHIIVGEEGKGASILTDEQRALFDEAINARY